MKCWQHIVTNVLLNKEHVWTHAAKHSFWNVLRESLSSCLGILGSTYKPVTLPCHPAGLQKDISCAEDDDHN